MASLSDWYRYVDKVSRPTARMDVAACEIPAWRPWLETADPEPAAEPVAIDRLPDLSELLGTSPTLPETASRAREEFEDLTIHDELPAGPVFGVPTLQVPSFELAAPRWGASTSAPAEGGRDDKSPSGIGAAVARIKASPSWELLGRAREDEATADGTRGRFRESRQELIERLVDPTLSLEQTAMILGVCPTTVRRYTNKGLLRHFRTKGNQRRFRLSDVAEFMESRAAEIEADSRADQAAGASFETEDV